MKNKTAILYYIAAVGFYIAAAFKFLAHDDSGMGIVWVLPCFALFLFG